MYGANQGTTERLLKNFDDQRRALEVLQKLEANMLLNPPEKRVLFLMASQWYQLSEGRRSVAHPLNQEMSAIHAMSDVQIQTDFTKVRSLFTTEDLPWISAGSIMFNLEETAQALLSPKSGLDEKEQKEIKQRLAEDRHRFLALYKQILQGLCSRSTPHVRRFWIGEYLENVRRHVAAWEHSLAGYSKSLIDLSFCNLEQVNLEGISLADVNLQESRVYYANLANTQVQLEQLWKARGFSTVQGLSQDTIEATRECSVSAWRMRLTKREAILSSISQKLSAASHVCQVGAEGSLALIAPEERALVQWTLLSSGLMNPLSADKLASAQGIIERGEEWFLNLSPQERDNYWVIFLAAYQFSLSPLLLAEAACSRLNCFKANLKEHQFAEWVESIQLADLTKVQRETIDAKRASLVLQQKSLLKEQQTQLEEASRYLISLQLDQIKQDLAEGNIPEAREAFLNLLLLAKKSDYVIDLRGKETLPLLFKGLDISGVRLYLAPFQCEQLSLIQRWWHSEGLFKAIEAGDEAAVRVGIEEAGWEVNLHNEAGRTALMAACFKKQLNIADYLYQAGANIHARIEREGLKKGEGDSILDGVLRMLPFEKDYEVIVKWLLKKGIKVSLENALQLAVIYDDPQWFEARLEEIGKSQQRPMLNQWQKLLRSAVEKGALQVVKWLIQQKPRSLEQSSHLTPLLHLACAAGQVEVVRLLLESKAVDVNSIDKQGRSALVYVAEQYLDRQWSEEPLRREPVKQYPAIATLLCQKGATHTLYTAILFINDPALKLPRYLRGKSEEVCDRQGNRPIHVAVRANREEVVEVLLDQKVVIDGLTTNGLTALQLACEAGFKSIAELLLRAGADPTGPKQVLTPAQQELVLAVRNSGLRDAERFFKELRLEGSTETPLHRCAKTGNVALIHLLCQFGADVNAKHGDMQKTPLHLAVQKGYREAAEVLLTYGACVSVVDAEGSLPVHLAMRAGHVFLMPILIQALLEQKDKNRQSCLDLAVTEEQQAMCAHYRSIGRHYREEEASKVQDYQAVASSSSVWALEIPEEKQEVQSTGHSVYSSWAISGSLNEQNPSGLGDFSTEEIALAKTASEKELPVDEFAHRAVVEPINSEDITHGIQVSKQELSQKDKKEHTSHEEEDTTSSLKMEFNAYQEVSMWRENSSQPPALSEDAAINLGPR